MAPPGGAIATNRNDIIDLVSDDEDVSRLDPVPDRNNFLPPTVASPSMQTSQSFIFNGLPDPNEFPSRDRTQGRPAVAGMMGPVPQSGSVPLGSPRQSSAHPTPRVNGVNKRSGVDQLPAFQPSVAYRDENTGAGVSGGSQGPNVMNASKKRRKLGDGIPQPIRQVGRISSAPILPPTFTNSPRMSNGGQPFIPAIGGKSIITGRDRAQASVMPPPMEPEMKRVLELQVLPHVHAAVRPYRETLTHAERTEIGQTAASRLVTVPGFMAHYLKNKKTLTPAFESQMKLNAYLFVNQGVEKVVNQRLQEEDPTRQLSSAQDNTMVGFHSSVGTSENGSTPPSEELDQPPLVRKRRRAISISTSTSYSNDHTDAEASRQNAQMSRSRRAAAQLPQGTYEQKRRKRRTKEEMAAARASSLQASEGDVRTTMSSPLAQSVRSAPVQQIQEFKPKRKRRTKAEMAEARRQEEEAYRHKGTVDRQSNQISGLYQQFTTSSSHTRLQDEHIGGDSFRAPALARGNVARVHAQQSIPQPDFFSPPIRGSTMGDEFKPYVRNATREKLNQQLSRLELGEEVAAFELDEINFDSFHVPFSSEEVIQLRQFLIDEYKMAIGSRYPDPADQIVRFMKSNKIPIPKMLKALEHPKRGQKKSRLLYTRSIVAIADFLADASATAVETPSELPDDVVERKVTSHTLISLLRGREGYGMTPDRALRGRSSFKVAANSYLEDALIRQSEWTDCSGDISSITWTGPNSFICGALAHSDSHNMQYNKPGNLLVGSTSLDVVKSYPDHRVIRPVVDNEEEKENANALDSMRTTQSPWMYESVVSTAHCHKNGFSFTASFDKTVKVWSVSETGSSMTLQGTWHHDEKVNFVAASPHHERIATACANNGNAVRVYSFDSDKISQSPYDEYCGDRSGEPCDEPVNHSKWSYQPATMQWGKAPGVVDFLLVGYSPRSITGNDNDVPELRRNSGEICLWNTSNKDQILIIAAKQNVFEVIWHPTQPIFLAATSPHGPCDLTKTKTQIRIFHQQETGTFSNVKTLDCPGIDINELTIKANSHVECFVTASCTNGSTYVWDTGCSDQPYHILDHGESLDNPDPDVPLDVGDSGVKFAAWGKSADRFYTGGSDGVIKAWDLRAVDGKTLVRNVMSISGGISTGVFNADCSKLLIGDATGKIYLLSVDDSDVQEGLKPAAISTMPRLATGSQLSRAIRRPKVVIPHTEPDPPPGYVVETIEKTGPEIAREYLESGQIIRIKEPYNFVYQGPFYPQMNRYNLEAHVNGDPNQKLLDEFWAVQQCVIKNQRELPFHTRLPIPMSSSNIARHQNNIEKNKRNFRLRTGFEWDPSNMSTELWELLDNGKLLELAEDVVYEHSYEPTPRFGMFKGWKKYLQSIREGEDEDNRLTLVEEDEGLVDDDE